MKKKFKGLYPGALCYILLAFMALLGASSCKKSSAYSFTTTNSASVQLVNTSTDSGPVALYVANVLRTANTISFGITSGYTQTYTGLQEVDVQQTSSNALLARTSTQIDVSGHYTFFLTGTTGGYGVITVKDDVTPSTTKAKVRFVQASTSLNYKIDVIGNGTTLFTAQSFRAISSFVEVTPGLYFFGVSATVTPVAGTTTPQLTLLASVSSVSLQAGSNYTIFTSGIPGATGVNALTVKVIKVD